MIHEGKQRAASYGMTHRGPVKFYIELLFLLGIDFDTDPQYPWAARILRDSDATDQTSRADRLHTDVITYLHTAAGPDRQYAKRALLRARKLPYWGPSRAGPDHESTVIEMMRELHPERCDYIGVPQLRALVARGLQEAQNHLVTSDPGIALIIALMFVLGHGVIRDPKYAFVNQTLQNNRIADPNSRAEYLYRKTMTYLDHALASGR
jgi:hypothetical protein